VTDALNRVTSYDYGLNTAAAGQRGSLLWVQDARYSPTGRQLSFQYNSFGQRTRMTDLNNVGSRPTPMGTPGGI